MGISNPKKMVALIAGPTASGKTALALQLAKSRNVVIINADSAQVYSELPILSAQPTESEQRSAPHRLFGYLDGQTHCSAARWANDAKGAIDEAHEAGALPVLVGGSGLYIQTLLDGIAPIPDIDPELRARIRALPVAQAYEALGKLDPAMAATLGPADIIRITRALEVIEGTGRSISEWQDAGARDARDVARDRVRKILTDHYPRHISDTTDAAIRAGYNIILPRERMQAGNSVW